MNGRHYSRPHPPLRQRTDDALPPCTEDDNYRTFFRLIDAKPADVPQVRTEALAICNTCDIRDACWDERADETWVKVLDGRKKSGGANVTPRLPRKGPSLAARRAERKARLTELEELGYSFNEAADELGLDRHALRKWCRAHDAPYGEAARPRKVPDARPLAGACGTPKGYVRHLTAKEETCEPCRAANRDRKAVWRASGKTETDDERGAA